ncbi:tetratricopeptide repeat protein [Actinoplanes sp. TRM 88003]|uniref:Tetratricopeptide repeat protein n=1 Tax=Paractinoplanes aksuensis TaxID=2939490 RepID=A0ABT1DFK8_9ACTN|nr:tetratricopeptide repeat protein [Actinoplanes aksuensis]MCO8269597.1 tetratricopeptide repeat protein [Actinoplanes aksuensis]
MDESPAYAVIREGMALREQGRPAEARALLEGLLAEVEGGDDAYAKVFLAHSLADVQPRPEDELAWDLRALAFMDELTDELAVERGNPGGRAALLPSLHLNLAVSYRRLGDDDNARRHYDLGHAHLGALADDKYGDSIRHAFATELA